MRRLAASLAVVLAAGCSAEPPAGGRAELDDAPVVRTLREAPPASDAPPVLGVSWHGADVALPSPALAVVHAGGALYATDQARTLWRVDASGARTEVARDVLVPPVTSDDGDVLALVVSSGRGEEGDLVVLENGTLRVVLRGLTSCAPLRFSPDGGVLVTAGVSPGGVAGLHAVDLRAARASDVCLTNCALVTGRPWGDRFVPLPGAEALRFEGAALTWDGGPTLALGAGR